MRSISSFRAVYKKCTMRFLIVATAVLACAAAVPSGLLAASYSAPLAYGLARAVPTISAGDINGAAIDAHVDASDHLRAAVDANRQLNDKVSELNGQAINNAEEYAWRSVDAVKTAEAQIDGATAGAAPIIAKSIVRTPVVAPLSYAAPVAYATAPVAYAAAPAYATAPVAYAASPAYAAAPYAYAGAPAVYAGYSPLAASKTVVSQSLSQTHPGAIYAASPLNYAHAW